MLVGKPAGRPQAQAHTVQAQWVVASQLLQHMPVPARLVEVVLRMDLKPVNARSKLKKVTIVNGPQANPKAEWVRAGFDSLSGIT